MTAVVFLFCHDVLICVSRLAPIASQDSALPPRAGEANDCGIKYLPVILERSEESGKGYRY